MELSLSCSIPCPRPWQWCLLFDFNQVCFIFFFFFELEFYCPVNTVKVMLSQSFNPCIYHIQPYYHPISTQSTNFIVFRLIDWVKVLQPSQSFRVMSGVVSLPNHTFPGQATISKQLTNTCAQSFARNWQLPFLNQLEGQNDHRKYFMINLYKRMLLCPAGIEPATSWSPVGRTSDWATEANHSFQITACVLLSTTL